MLIVPPLCWFLTQLMKVMTVRAVSFRNPSVFYHYRAVCYAAEVSGVSVHRLQSRSDSAFLTQLLWKTNETWVIYPHLVCLGQEVSCVSGFWNIFIYEMRYLREGIQVYTQNVVVFPINTHTYTMKVTLYISSVPAFWLWPTAYSSTWDFLL